MTDDDERPRVVSYSELLHLLKWFDERERPRAPQLKLAPLVLSVSLTLPVGETGQLLRLEPPQPVRAVSLEFTGEVQGVELVSMVTGERHILVTYHAHSLAVLVLSPTLRLDLGRTVLTPAVGLRLSLRNNSADRRSICAVLQCEAMA